MICKDCGKFVSAKDGEIVDGEFICNECLNENYIKCADCGEYHKEDDMYYIEDTQEEVCNDCYENNGYFYCKDCGKFYSESEFIYIEDTQECVCETCAKYNYTQCDDCGRWF